jgi:hypothetical protein
LYPELLAGFIAIEENTWPVQRSVQFVQRTSSALQLARGGTYPVTEVITHTRFVSAKGEPVTVHVYRSLCIPRREICSHLDAITERGTFHFLVLHPAERNITILNKVPPFATKLLSVHLFIIITPHF